MRNGKPVISTIHSGIPELITHGKNGFLAQEHDFESFAKYMVLLLEDESLSDEMGRSGKELITARIPLGSRGKEIRSLILNEVNRSKG
jgi:glycosyltransferase involved in cell wall biosynthesis